MSVCKIADATDWTLPWFIQTVRDVLHEEPRWHVKLWEWAMLYHGLDALGYLRENVSAVGLGCGTEPLIFALANRVKHVIATDLYSPKSAWFHARLNTEDLSGTTTIPFPVERLSVRNMDFENGYDVPEDSADLIWSTSSVEHVSSRDALAALFMKIARSLKTDGVFAMTTDWYLAGPSCYEPHRIIFDRETLNMALRDVPLRLVSALDLRISSQWENAPCWPGFRSGQLGRPQVTFVLENGETVFTSVCMFFKRADGTSAPDIIPPDSTVIEELVYWRDKSRKLASVLDT